MNQNPPYRTNEQPAPSSACQDCGVDMHAPLCGICERKRMVQELETLRAFKTYVLEEGDAPKVRERFRQATGMELP